MPALQGISNQQITATKGCEIFTLAGYLAWGGDAMNHPDQPTPLQTLAVRLALCRFHQHHPHPCGDPNEWKADCEAVAWCAVLEADARYTLEISTASLDALDQETIAELLVDERGDGYGLVLSEAERARVDYLARCAKNALKRYWRDERQYYSRLCGLEVPDEEGEWVEREIEDESALEALRLVEARVDRELLLEHLRREVDGVDWAIVQGVLAEKTQAAIAQALGISQQAVSKRIARVRAKLWEIQGEIG